MPDTLDHSSRPPSAERFAGKVEDLPEEDLQFLAHVDQRNKRAGQTLEALLAQCDPTAPMPDDDQAWLADPPKGREII